MSQQRKTKYHVRKRMFLNRDVDYPAYVIGIVENTSEIPNDDSDYKWGTIELKLGDCNRRVAFNFTMETRQERSDSLDKINRIAEVVKQVRDAIEKEVQSINKRPKIEEKIQKSAS